MLEAPLRLTHRHGLAPWISLRDAAEDAIALYHPLLPHVVEQGTHASRYDEAFAVVKKISELRVAHGQRALFTGELAAIRREWKRKRNFMKLLDAL